MIHRISTFWVSLRLALIHALVMTHYLFLTTLSFDVMLRTMAIMHRSIVKLMKRQVDLESEKAECVRVKKKTFNVPRYFNWPSTATYLWFDDFMQMIDKVSENSSDIILPGDFNIDLFEPQPIWRSTS